jgi:inner membrane transporter RhtA
LSSNNATDPWALYIVSTTATGRRWAGVDGLAVASTVATLAIAPFAVATAGARLLEPRLLVLGALVGLLSSVILYSLEMAALRTLPHRVFGILMSLEPAVAALVAAILLREWLTPPQLLAMACVTAATTPAESSPIGHPPIRVCSMRCGRRRGTTPSSTPTTGSRPTTPG